MLGGGSGDWMKRAVRIVRVTRGVRVVRAVRGMKLIRLSCRRGTRKMRRGRGRLLSRIRVGVRVNWGKITSRSNKNSNSKSNSKNNSNLHSCSNLNPQ